MRTDKAKKMKEHKNTQLDRLSDLPDDLIQHILSFLDTKYAVQTCVLSKRWVNLWSDLTVFNFCYHHSTPSWDSVPLSNS
ncbi:hypothetical protein SLEP1_g10947 [Rubroshorea leprosula]|uniref:F-box domain-containing protein n=1 Tax=Rubroshorea leprosula TaxID=152421 RepID=A0AAV5I9R2_9ROSI|nr:hypothetical protein SLEP1_g10947 [Rubroshorea leprosula]